MKSSLAFKKEIHHEDTKGTKNLGLSLCVLCVFVVSTFAQDAPPPLPLNTAVEQALSHYPAIRAAQAQADAASANIDLSRTSFLPRADLLWQEESSEPQ